MTFFKHVNPLKSKGKSYNYYSLDALEQAGVGQVSKLPYSIKVLLEAVLRQVDGRVITKEHVENLSKMGNKRTKRYRCSIQTITCYPTRFHRCTSSC